MRTEEQLRQTLASLAEQAPPPGRVLDGLADRAGRARRSSRHVAVVLVAVVVLVLALVLPSVLTDRTAEPAGTRVRGNWNLVHRVAPAAGSTVREQAILADSELSIVDFTREDVSDCTVEVHGPRSSSIPTVTENDVRVEIGGHEGFYRDLPPSTPLDTSNPQRGGLYWTASDHWVLVLCYGGLERVRELAERVVLEPVTVRLPFRLPSLPDRYRVLSVLPERRTETSAARETVVGLEPVGAGTRPLLIISVTTGTAVPDADRRGVERETVAGLPAVVDVEMRRLCLVVQDHTACVAEAPADSAAEPTTAPWPAGRRDLLVEVVEGLQLASDLSDPTTWFLADEALPR